MSAIAVGLQDEFRTALERLIGAWFPRIVDTLHGGYLCDFDHKWRKSRRNSQDARVPSEVAAFRRACLGGVTRVRRNAV